MKPRADESSMRNYAGDRGAGLPLLKPRNAGSGRKVRRCGDAGGVVLAGAGASVEEECPIVCIHAELALSLCGCPMNWTPVDDAGNTLKAARWWRRDIRVILVLGAVWLADGA